MKVHQYVIAFILFIGILSIVGNFALKLGNNYGVETSDETTLYLTGQNTTEFNNLKEEITLENADDGYLANFKLFANVWDKVKNTFTQSGEIMTSTGEVVGVDRNATGYIIMIILIIAFFSIIYLFVK